MVKLFIKKIAHVKLHDNFLSQKEIENDMLIFFPSYFIMFHTAEKISLFKSAQRILIPVFCSFYSFCFNANLD